MPDFVLAFDSTHAALSAQKAFQVSGVRCLTIPTPRAISAGCGIALKFSADSAKQATAYVRDAGVPSDTISLYEEMSRIEFSPVPLA